MKTIFKSLMMFAAAALTLAGCEKETVSENAAPEVSGEKITVKAAVKNAATRVSVSSADGDYSAVWDDEDAIDIVEFAGKSGSITENTAYQLVAAENIEVADDLAMFEFELDKTEGEGFTYYAVYPGGNDDSFVAKKYQELVLPMPAVQKPTAASLIDPKANVVIAKAETDAQAPDLYFDEVINAASYARMTIKGLPEGVTPKTVKFENKTISGSFGVNIAGCYWYMVNDGSFAAAYGSGAPNATTAITVDQSEAQDANVVWFGLAPVGKITDFVVTVTGSDDKEYVKTVTGAETLNFTAGKILNFSVDFTGKSAEEPAVFSKITTMAEFGPGEYIIATYVSDNNYVIATTPYSSHLTAEEVEINGDVVVNPDSKYIWTIEENSGSYKLNGGTYYLGWSSGTSFSQNQNDSWSLYNKDGLFGFANTKDESRVIQYNGSSDFRPYSNKGACGLTLFKKEKPEVPKIIVEQETLNISADGDSSTMTVTVTDYTSDVTVDISYDNGSGWVSEANWNDNILTYSIDKNENADSRTAYITIKASNEVGEASKTITVNQKGSATQEYIDVLNSAWTGISGTTYTSIGVKNGSSSNAIYTGLCAGDQSTIQLRSDTKTNYSGIVTTTSGGVVKKISVVWDTTKTHNGNSGGTATGRQLNIYGNNTAYTSAQDLYSTNSQGTLIGSIICGTSTELEINNDYKFIGFCSNNGALYLDEVQITWED